VTDPTYGSDNDGTAIRPTFLDFSGVDTLRIYISAACPSCGYGMRYTKYEADQSNDIKRVDCVNCECPEFEKPWNLDMRNGTAIRGGR
jgi:hypothetical protein